MEKDGDISSGTPVDLPRRPWVVVGSIAAVLASLATVVALLPAYLSWNEARRSNQRQAAEPRAELVALRLGDPVDVEATAYDRSDNTRTQDEARSEVADVTLTNQGSEPAVFTEAVFRVSEYSRIEQCVPQGGPLQVTGKYDVLFPNPLPRTPFTVVRPIRYEVAPHSADRLTFKIGHAPLREGDTSALYHIHASLKQANPLRTLELGHFVLVGGIWYGSVKEWAGDYFTPMPDISPTGCTKKNAAMVARFAQLSNEHSPVFEELLTLSRGVAR